MGVRRGCLVFVVAACSAAHAYAQTGPAIGADALPQLVNVGVAEAKAAQWGLAASGGFGVLSAQEEEEGTHQRMLGSIAGAVTLTDGVAVGLRFGGHYDLHPDDAQGSDDSLVGEPTLRVRVATELSPTFHVGVDFALTAPGKDAPSIAFDAMRADARVLATYVGSTGSGLAAQAGFRFDQTGNAAPDLNTTRPGDRISLGLNDFHALLIGVGGWKRWSSLALLGEATWNPWLGSGAPSPLQSPLHLTAGARYFSSDSLAWEILIDGLLSERPEPQDNRLAAIDPRVSVLFGIRLMSTSPAAAPLPVEVQPSPAEPAPVQQATATTATVRGRVTASSGTPVADAEVKVVGEGYERSTRTGADGSYEIGDVPLGQATLRVSGRRLQPFEQPLEVVAAGVSADVQPTPAPAQGHLRGLIRSFDGKTLAAQITIEPTGQTLTANAEGEFELALPPGEYQVRIAIAGYGAQSRTVQLEDDGVTLLNVDLKKARR